MVFFRYLELFLGQFYRCGNISLWARIAPSMKGIGIASFLIVTAVTLFYTTIIGKSSDEVSFVHQEQEEKENCRAIRSICFFLSFYINCQAHALFYLIASFQRIMPWSICSHPWNTDACSERMKLSDAKSENLTLNNTKVSAADQYYHIYMLGINHSNGFTDLGSIKIDVLLCLITVFILMYICICRGVKSTGKTRYKQH